MSKTIEGEILTLLMGKEVICPWRYPTLHRELKKPPIQKRVEDLLRHFNLRLETTRSEQAYFAVYRVLDAEAKEDVRKTFRDVMKHLRFYLAFMDFLTKALHSDVTMAVGEEVVLADLLVAINSNTALQVELSKLSTSQSGASVQAQLQSLLSRLERDNLLVQHDPKRDAYTFTGKLEYIQDVLIFIQEAENIPVESNPASTEERKLL